MLGRKMARPFDLYLGAPSEKSVFCGETHTTVDLDSIEESLRISCNGMNVGDIWIPVLRRILEDAGATHLYDEAQKTHVMIRASDSDLVVSSFSRAYSQCLADRQPEQLS